MRFVRFEIATIRDESPRRAAGRINDMIADLERKTQEVARTRQEARQSVTEAHRQTEEMLSRVQRVEEVKRGMEEHIRLACELQARARQQMAEAQELRASAEKAKN